MNTRHVKHYFLKLFAVSAFFLFAFASTAKAGLDSYEIYLNNKLLLRQAVNQPLSLESLQLTERNSNDQLVIRYFQCNAPNKLGSNRNIIIKDEQGRKVKEWKFKDASGANTAMVIPVKELLQLREKNAGISLGIFYTAEGHPQEQQLTSLKLSTKSTTFTDNPELHIAFFVVNKFMRI